MREKLNFSYFKNRLFYTKSRVVLFFAYFVFCVFSFVYFLIKPLYLYSFMSFVLILLLPALILAEWLFDMNIPNAFLVLLMSICLGSLLGAGYDFYFLIPSFDKILHTLSGFLFACLGFFIAELFVGDPKSLRAFTCCVFVGFVFSLAIGFLWELIEYFGSDIFNVDMQNDTLVTEFRSFFFSGSHLKIESYKDIAQTIIYFENGETLTIPGYLDLGVIDTMNDMIVCFIGAIVFIVTMIICRLTGTKSGENICPFLNERAKNRIKASLDE